MLLHSLENGKEEEEGEINIELYYVEVCSTYAEEGGGGESTALGGDGERRRKGRGRMEAWVELYISDLGDGLLHFFILFAFSFACMHICRERMLHYISDP